jgi:L-fuconolactonase
MSDLDFAIVDAHVHQWDPRTTPRATSLFARLLGRWPDFYLKVGRSIFPKAIREFVGRPDHLLLAYLPADHAQDSASSNVDTVVHVEAGWAAPGALGAVGETRWLETLGFESVGKTLGAIVAHADLGSSRADEVLRAHMAASSRMRGVRQMAARHPQSGVFAWSRHPHLYCNADFLRGFERLAEHGLRFDAWVYSPQLPDVAALAQRFPQVPIVLDHLGTPVGAAGPFCGVGTTAEERERIVSCWRDDLAQVAEHKNVFAKISGLAMPALGFGFHTRPEPPSAEELVERLGPLVRHALDVFGVDRCFFASNFPMDRVSAPYARIFEAYARLAKERGPHAPRALLRENALRFYGI